MWSKKERTKSFRRAAAFFMQEEEEEGEDNFPFFVIKCFLIL